jgi:hypothetical protein
MKFWADLLKDDDKDMLIKGVDAMFRIHYYTNLFGGGRFWFLEAGKGNRLH